MTHDKVCEKKFRHGVVHKGRPQIRGEGGCSNEDNCGQGGKGVLDVADVCKIDIFVKNIKAILPIQYHRRRSVSGFEGSKLFFCLDPPRFESWGSKI